MDSKDFQEFRSIVIPLILMTDPSKHFVFLNKLKKLMNTKETNYFQA